MTTKLIIHTDGGARGNPGPAGIGVVIEQDGKIIHEFGKTIGETTNNVAEYTAVIEALQYIISEGVTWAEGLPRRGPLVGVLGRKPTAGPRGEEYIRKEIHFLLDSKLVVEQLNGNYKIKDAKLRELSLKIRMLEQELSGGVITYAHVPREKNKEADRLVNQALDDNS